MLTHFDSFAFTQEFLVKNNSNFKGNQCSKNALRCESTSLIFISILKYIWNSNFSWN